MSYRARSLLFAPRLLETIRGEPLTVVDVGARGEAIEPFRSLLRSPSARGAVRIVAFEPDDGARGPSAATDVRWIPAAAWSGAGKVELFLTRDPSASSVFEPDESVLGRYRAEHQRPRQLDRVVEVEAMTVDQVLEEGAIDADFLKLDTQGAEHEILDGSRGALGRLHGVLLETWTTPVHRGQRCLGEILTLMADHGYSLADITIGGRWQRRTKLGQRLDARGDPVVAHALFFNDRGPIAQDWSPAKLLKAAALADVWGHADFALQLLERRATPETAWAADEIARRRGRRRRGARVRDTVTEQASQILGIDLRWSPSLG